MLGARRKKSGLLDRFFSSSKITLLQPVRIRPCDDAQNLDRVRQGQAEPMNQVLAL